MKDNLEEFTEMYFFEYQVLKSKNATSKGGLSNNIFASTYTYYIPNKDELIGEVERIINRV